MNENFEEKEIILAKSQIPKHSYLLNEIYFNE